MNKQWIIAYAAVSAISTLAIAQGNPQNGPSSITGIGRTAEQNPQLRSTDAMRQYQRRQQEQLRQQELVQQNQAQPAGGPMTGSASITVDGRTTTLEPGTVGTGAPVSGSDTLTGGAAVAPSQTPSAAPATPINTAPGTAVNTAPGTAVNTAPGTPITGAPGTPITGAPGTPITGAPGTPITGAPGTPIVTAPSGILLRTPSSGGTGRLPTVSPNPATQPTAQPAAGNLPGSATQQPLRPDSANTGTGTIIIHDGKTSRLGDGAAPNDGSARMQPLRGGATGQNSGGGTGTMGTGGARGGSAGGSP